MLNEQLQKDIDNEAKAEAKKMTARVPIFRYGYEAGWYDAGEKYVEKWQAAEEKADRHEKALKDFAHRLKEHCEKMGITPIVLQRITIDMEEFTLTPKTSEDE